MLQPPDDGAGSPPPHAAHEHGRERREGSAEVDATRIHGVGGGPLFRRKDIGQEAISRGGREALADALDDAKEKDERERRGERRGDGGEPPHEARASRKKGAVVAVRYAPGQERAHGKERRKAKGRENRVLRLVEPQTNVHEFVARRSVAEADEVVYE